MSTYSLQDKSVELAISTAPSNMAPTSTVQKGDEISGEALPKDQNAEGQHLHEAEQDDTGDKTLTQSLSPFLDGHGMPQKQTCAPSLALPFPTRSCSASSSSQRFATMPASTPAHFANLPNGWTSQPYVPRAHSNANLMPLPHPHQHVGQRSAAFQMHQSRSAQDLHSVSSTSSSSARGCHSGQPSTAPWSGCPTTLAAAAQLATIGVGIGPGVNPHVAINGACSTNVGPQNPPIVNTGNNGPMCVQPGDWVCSTCGFVNWRRRRVCMRCFPFADPNEMSSTIANGAYLAAQLAAGVEPPPDAIANLAMSRRTSSSASCILPMTNATPHFQLPVHNPMMDTRALDRPAQSTPPSASVTSIPHGGMGFVQPRSNVNVSDLEELMSKTLSMRANNSSAASSAGSAISSRTHDGSHGLPKLASSSSLRCKMQSSLLAEARVTPHSQAATSARSSQDKWTYSAIDSSNDKKLCTATAEFLRRQSSTSSLMNGESDNYSTPEHSQSSSDGVRLASSSKSSFSISSQSNGHEGFPSKLWTTDTWTESPELGHLSSIRSSPQTFARTPRVSPLNLSTRWLSVPQAWDPIGSNSAQDVERASAAEGEQRQEYEESLRTAQDVKSSPFRQATEPRPEPTSAANELDEIFVPSAHDRRSNVQPISPSAYKTMMAAAAAQSMPSFAATHSEAGACQEEATKQAAGNAP